MSCSSNEVTSISVSASISKACLPSDVVASRLFVSLVSAAVIANSSLASSLPNLMLEFTNSINVIVSSDPVFLLASGLKFFSLTLNSCMVKFCSSGDIPRTGSRTRLLIAPPGFKASTALSIFSRLTHSALVLTPSASLFTAS